MCFIIICSHFTHSARMTASDSLEHTWLKRRGRGTAGASWAYVVPTAAAAPPVAATVTQTKPTPLIAHVSITVAAGASFP